MSEEIGAPIIYRDNTGRRTVREAPDLIWVSRDLLEAEDLDPDAIEPDGTLRLDTAGEYRYRALGACPACAQVLVYRRVEAL